MDVVIKNEDGSVKTFDYFTLSFDNLKTALLEWQLSNEGENPSKVWIDDDLIPSEIVQDLLNSIRLDRLAELALYRLRIL